MRRLRTAEELIWISFSFKSEFKGSPVLRGSFWLCRSKWASPLGLVFFSRPHPFAFRRNWSGILFQLADTADSARLTPITPEISLYVLAVCSCKVTIFEPFLGRADLKPMQLHWAPRLWGPRASGAPRHGGWAGSSFLSDTPCAREL